MKNKNSNTLMLITGIIAGASATIFLKSKKGQQVIDIIMAKGEELKTVAMDNAQNIITEGQDIISDVIDSNKDKLSMIAEDIKDTAESGVSEFQHGVEKAKNKLNKA